MSDEFSLWDAAESDAPGLSKEQVLKWEAENGVQLPKLLRKAYREHNGGVVRSSSIQLWSLDQVRVPDDDAWDDMADEEEDGFEDRNRILIIGEDLDIGGSYFLNYNLCHDDGDPSIWNHFYDGTGPSRLSKSVSRYLKKQASTSETPDVDWQETESFPILCDESIDESSWLPPGTITRYRLVQGEDKLILFEQGIDMDRGGQRLTRTELPLPLDPDSMSLELRLDGGPWGLHLEPLDGDEIVSVESVQRPGGGWKNSRSRGVPIYETIESESKERLENLRIQLIGAEAAREVAAADDRMAALERRMQASSPEEQKIIGLQMLQGMQTEMPDLTPPGELPPELAEASAQIESLQRKMFEELERSVGGLQVPPEVQAMIEGLKKKMQRPGQ